MTQGGYGKDFTHICKKHGIMKRNFWSKEYGGVVLGCPECDKERTS